MQGGEDSPNDRERVRYNCAVSSLRKAEYPMLQGLTYLDHAGTTLPSVSLIDDFSTQQKKQLLANPHSATSTSPNLTQTLTRETRLKVLELFKASPEHFDVVFVANATAATKLVFEAFHDHEQGFDYYYHRDCHTSIVGGRELARNHHCFAGKEADQITERWLSHTHETVDVNAPQRPTLFAYPAQSNMNGRRLPLSWPSLLRKEGRHQNTYVLLDVAAYVSTSPLDLSDHKGAPDFLALSFYKIFGFPNLGALIVRKEAAHVFDKKRYFGGGTTDMITCIEDPWVAKKRDFCAALEDGTGPAHSILALKCAIDAHARLYGGLQQISKHTTWLARQLYEQLDALRHTNGRRVCVIYKDPASEYGDTNTQGGTVAFNVRTADGGYFDTAFVGNEALKQKIHVRSGSLCNPAGMANALGFSEDELRHIYDTGLRCGEGSNWTGTPLGMVRVSFGACSTLEDAWVFVRFIRKCFVDRVHDALRTPQADEKELKALGLSSVSNSISSMLMTLHMGDWEKGKRYVRSRKKLIKTSAMKQGLQRSR